MKKISDVQNNNALQCRPVNEERRISNILLWNQKIWESRVSNTGDLAMILNAILKIKKEIPYARLHLFSDDPPYVQERYGVQAYPIQYVFHPLKLYRILKKMDLVLLNGGTVVQDNYFIGVIPVNLGIPLLASLMGKQVFCLAVGAADEDEISRAGKVFSVFALRRFEMITVRDEESRQLFDRWLNGNVPVTFTHDIAVDTPGVDFEPLHRTLKEGGIDLENRPTVAIAARRIFHHEKTFFYFIPSSLRTKLGLVHPLFTKRLAEFQLCLAQFCDYIIQKYNVNILFIPFYPSGGDMDSDDNKSQRRLFTSEDTDFTKKVLDKIKNKQSARILQSNFSPEEIITIISKCKAMIGVPYHSIVLASSRNVPVIGIGYVSKVRRYMKMLNMEEYLLPAEIQTGVSLELLIQKFDRLWDNRQNIMKHLSIINHGFSERASENISLLKDVLNREKNKCGSGDQQR